MTLTQVVRVIPETGLSNPVCGSTCARYIFTRSNWSLAGNYRFPKPCAMGQLVQAPHLTHENAEEDHPPGFWSIFPTSVPQVADAEDAYRLQPHPAPVLPE